MDFALAHRNRCVWTTKSVLQKHIYIYRKAMFGKFKGTGTYFLCWHFFSAASAALRYQQLQIFEPIAIQRQIIEPIAIQRQLFADKKQLYNCTAVNRRCALTNHLSRLTARGCYKKPFSELPGLGGMLHQILIIVLVHRGVEWVQWPVSRC